MAGTDGGGSLEALRRQVRLLEQRVEGLDAVLSEHVRSGGEFRKAINRLGDALGASHDREAVMAGVLETSALYLQAASGSFYLVVAGRDVLRPAATCGRPPHPAGELAWGDGVAGHAAQSGAVAVWPGPHSDLAGPAPAEPPVTTAIAAPVRAGGRVYGVLALYGRLGGSPFAGDDVTALATLARQAEPAIENTYLYEEATRLAITDGLTSLWNRRQFDLRVRSELQRGVRFGEPFAVVLVDADHFKDVNDRCGHQAGDAVLIELAQRLTGTVRDVDIVARIGGEEFGLVLPNTPLEGAVRVAEKVQQVVAGTPIDTGAKTGTVRVTVSAGVAAYPDHGRTPAELFRSADEALYRAKEKGRNRIEPALAAAPASTAGAAAPASTAGAAAPASTAGAAAPASTAGAAAPASTAGAPQAGAR